MKKTFILFLLLVVFNTVFAQYTLRLVVTAVPTATKDVAKRAAEGIYVAGNFNNWNPKDENFKLKPLGTNRMSITLKDIPAGMYAFKITCGGWSKVESTTDGRYGTDRIVEVKDADVTQDFTIGGWKDEYPEKP